MAEAVALKVDEQIDRPRWRPRITHERAPVDLDRAERAATEMLAALGLPIDSEDMFETPRRLVHAYAEMLTPPEFDSTTFGNAAGYDELVLVSDIPVHSLCEHHLLPFSGVAHVGYIPGARIVGLSKLARVVDHFARALQVQERLTTQVAGWLQRELAPKGVGVVLEAEHMCMSIRGVQKPGATTVTSALHGLVRDDPRTRGEFLALAASHA
jgi:GTP cyclohydrolase IA